jgi:hypothetical protein
MWEPPHSATGAIESALKYLSPDTHWIACRLATAGGKHIKTWPLSAIVTSYDQSLPVATTSTRQQQGYVPSKRPDYLPSERQTCTSLAGQCNLHSAEVTTATAYRQPNAVKLGRLPARCLLNLPCCCPSGPGNLPYTLRPFQGHHPPFQPTSADRIEDLHTPSKTAPFRAINSSSASIRAQCSVVVVQ